MKQMEHNYKFIFSQTNIITILKFSSPLPLNIAIKGPIQFLTHNLHKTLQKFTGYQDRRWLLTIGCFYYIKTFRIELPHRIHTVITHKANSPQIFTPVKASRLIYGSKLSVFSKEFITDSSITTDTTDPN